MERSGRTLGTVLVASDHRLVGEALRAALASRGVAAVLLPGWPPDLPEVRVPVPRGGTGPDLLLIVCEVDLQGRAGEVRAVGQSCDLPWVVLTQGPPSSLWGGLLEAGASGVLGSDLGLDELIAVVDQVREGRSPMNDVVRRSVLRSWRTTSDVPEPWRRHHGHLTSRESDLLRLLYEGGTVKAIAERYGISEAAVRAQVQAMLRRLART
ncbi:response regulator transcription factor [Nocardioides mangrovi]|uniref:Response regulator transcription factor n=1 Tax=Nocardioides mangrovi TaxID=2874580 RepID=A0ABS7UFD4_9ACTN|nr:response regulator transcription factor [Nocardioides mangrovi]MBZ5739718.1 response regulator transcription factor [Nocardioides mangrovi]